MLTVRSSASREAQQCLTCRTSLRGRFLRTCKLKISCGCRQRYLGIDHPACRIEVVGRLCGKKATSRQRTGEQGRPKLFAVRQQPGKDFVKSLAELTVSVLNRLLRQQLVREAEGYLDLVSVLEDQWPLP